WPVGRFVAVTSGGKHHCALAEDGHIECWGENDFGQINAPTGNDFVKVAGGYVHTCALRANGTVTCWGPTNSMYPAENVGQTVAPPGTFKSVSSGVSASHNCALSSDGTPTCWGLGTTSSSCQTDGNCGQAIPPPGEKFQQISCGF